MSIRTVSTLSDLRRRVSDWRAAGERIGLVPTMGALHEGHLTLVRKAAADCDRVIVTIFVNPTQFGPGEDYESYPRDLASDLAKLEGTGASLVYAPGVAEIYPERDSTRVRVSGVSEGLCGGDRPVHFEGVATVVTRLLLQAQSDAAYFGEKDYQQLQVIRALVRDLSIPVEIIGVPTVREAGGLALSSRNAYLSKTERAAAPVLYAALQEIAGGLSRGDDPGQLIAKGREKILAAGFSRIDYLELRDAETLETVTRVSRPARLLVAAHLGRARLIDNLAVLPPEKA